ncbi:molybdopterin-dependent oxidoreductase [Cellulomonas marina]|uniref:molybdopterin-dependent oxidoreductase n=1 Tax=Cellulomonas marina TaxID=988821 RepID=UPI000B7CD39C|nr:molybdopterin-dependent oxidoreductase [Cellulomonas marina]GIG28304.1 hypothetical protein Cma02nite_09040 [Cellulomonas marina]
MADDLPERRGPASPPPAGPGADRGRRAADPSRAERWRGALAGVLAAALTLGVAQLLAGLTDASSAPLSAVGDAFIDLTPAWLKDVAIAVFGVHDKTALLVGAVLVLAVLAALVGVVAVRRPRLGTLAVVALGAVGAVAAATRADAGPLAPLPALLGAAAGVVALGRLAPRAAAPAGTTGRTSAGRPGAGGVDRRSFLGGALVVGGLAAITALGGVGAGAARGGAAAARALVRLPAPAQAAVALPPEAAAPVDGVVPVVTPNETFYRIDTAFVVPDVDPAGWELRVHGLVEQEVRLTWDELLASELVEAWVTLTCVSNTVGGDLAGNARWLGLPVREVLARARPLPGADMVLSTSSDGFTASTPLEALTDDRDALLAVGMNGEPLPPAHGFPVRMVVPGLYGYVSATKWVVDLEVTRFAERSAYWTQRGWSERGPVKTASRIEVPRQGATLPAGTVAVGGTAWAQHRGITGVEVQVDDGPWQPATLAGEISVDTWRQWSFAWHAAPGDHLLRVRASDPDGPQTGDRVGAVPDGATGWHEVAVRVA